ncbi:hypothetical protein F0L17_07460 [Streptomyces sp. TRM43335]|uniref:Uncharacterized protein n=1 Tax=Streptomyces taklimakanensis TaxID=2569853 RepID=A0A6G2B9M5_9ACTN|nr:hypothetical protein [Streptomyces taklimakanensis]MTE18971.1 hypothetical protein [Streptomyces taklimakanensis]
MSGYGLDGRLYEVRIARTLDLRRGTRTTCHVVCGSCGHRHTARGLDRSEAAFEAAHHLAEHGAGRGGRTGTVPAPWILGLLGTLGFLAGCAVAFLGH